jgi:hypothetical protein
MSENKKPELKQETIDLAKLIKEAITVDAKTGTTAIAADIYARTLPETITINSIQEINAHNSMFLAAAGLAFTESVIPVLKKQKTIDDAKIEIPLTGKDTLGFHFVRSAEVQAQPGVKDSPKTTAYGLLTAKWESKGLKNKGEFKKVKEIAAAAAAKALANS